MRRKLHFLSLLMLIATLAHAETQSLYKAEAMDTENISILKSPEIQFSENSFSFVSPAAGTVMYYVDQTKEGDKTLCVNTYSGGEISFAGEIGKYYVHAYTATEDALQNSDSEITTQPYFVIYADNQVLPFYKLIRDVSDLMQDDVVLLVSPKEYSQALSITQNKTNRSGAQVDIFNDMIAEPAANVALLKVIKSDNTYSFYNINGDSGATYSSLGYLSAKTTTYNELITATAISVNSQASIVINPATGASTIKFGGSGTRKYLRYNTENLFSNYDLAAGNLEPYFYVLHKQSEYTPDFGDVKMTFGGEIGNTRRLSLGEEHPELSYSYSEPGIVEIDDNGVITTLRTGNVTVTVTWPNTLEWKGDSAEFTVTVNDYNLSAPEIEVGESTFAIVDKNLEGSKLYYCVNRDAGSGNIADGEWTEYTSPVAFSGEHGKHYVHAIAKSCDADLYGNSAAVADYYYVADLDFGEYILLKDINNLKTGDQVIIATNDQYMKGISTIQDNNNRRATDIEIWRNVVVEPSAEVGVFQIAKSGEGASARYTFYSTNGTKGYLQATSSQYNLLKTLATAGKGAPASITLAEDDSRATIKYNSFSRSYLGFYTNGSVFSFACYDSEREEPLYLYVYRKRNKYDHPFADTNLILGETTDNNYQFDLGSNRPEIRFAVDNPEIADIDTDGLVTARNAGSTTVVASWDATDEWSAGTVLFNILVEKPAPVPDNLPGGNYDDEVTLSFEALEGHEIYYITNISEQNWTGDREFDENDINCWTKLEDTDGSYEITLDKETYGETPWIKVAYVIENDGTPEFDSTIAHLAYTLDYKIYAPVISDTQADGFTRLVTIDFDDRNEALRDESKGYTLKYNIDGGKSLAVDGTPVRLDVDTYGFRPIIKVWIEDKAGNRLPLSTSRTIYLDGNQECESWNIHEMVADAISDEAGFYNVPGNDGLSITYKVYTLEAPAHTFHNASDGLYVTDNSVYGDERSCIRIEGIPSDAELDHRMEILALRGRICKVTLNDGTEKYYMQYMSHAEGADYAMPSCRSIGLADVMLDKNTCRMLDHHYMRLVKVYYDATANTISMADSDIPQGLAESPRRAPEGHTVNVIYDVEDPNSKLPTSSGTYTISGYPSYSENGGMTFVALNAENEVVTGVTVIRTDSVNLTALPEGCEVFRLDGTRIDTSAPEAGTYIVRMPDGQTVKTIIR